MKNINEKATGAAWGVAAGLLLAGVGLSLDLSQRALHGAAAGNDFVASGVAMLGIFLSVYSTHELRRKRQH
ncbi:hypothetical protein QZM03_24385 [Burkholderia multivorans]|uniref:hypothetical protein n=1 Tax=Burkholderia multivorans TaxID=87883 RepID=UPI000CFECB6D|nr:hypothetical protein [Burkholderia multivorans]MDN7450483.1 hypothetical protein [Burkholderia multivorans]PRF27321.1 hypothetical protein C6Q03_03820 [Burkholderia multivorans]